MGVELDEELRLEEKNIRIREKIDENLHRKT